MSHEDPRKIDLSPEQEVAKERVLYLLKGRKFDLALKEIQRAGLPEEVKESEEVQTIIKEQLKYHLSGGFTWIAQEIIEGFKPDEKTIQEALRLAIIDMARQGMAEEIERVKNEFNVPDEVFQTEEAREAAKEGLEKLMKNNYPEKDLKEIFGLE